MAESTARAVWVANAHRRLLESGRWLYLEALNRALKYRANTGKPLRPELVIEIKQELDRVAGYDGHSRSTERRYYSNSAEYAYRASRLLAEFGDVPTFADIMRDYLDYVQKDSQKEGRIGDEYIRNLNAHRELSMRRDAVELLARVYDAAGQDSDVQWSVDVAFGGFFNALTKDSPQTIIDANPNLKAQLKLDAGTDALPEDAGSIRALIGEAMKRQQEKLEASLKTATNVIKDAGAAVEQMGRNADDLMEALVVQAAREQQRAQSEAEAHSTMAIATVGAMLLNDPADRRRLMAVARAYVDLEAASQRLRSAGPTGLGGVAGSGWLGALGHVASYITIAAALVEAFSADDRPTSDALILSSLRELSEQIAKFREQVMGALVVIDQKLSQLFTLAAEGIAAINARIQDMHVDLGEARSAISKAHALVLGATLRLESKIDFLLQAPQKSLLVDVLNFRRDRGRGMSVAEYDGAVGRIRTVFEQARDFVFIGDPAALLSVDTLHKALEKSPAADVVGILQGFANDAGGFSFSGRRAHSDTVGLCALMLSVLANESPDVFPQRPIALHRDLLGEFGQARADRHSILRGSASPGLAGMLKSLHARYKVAAEKVLQAAAAARADQWAKDSGKREDIAAAVLLAPWFAGHRSNQAVPLWLQGEHEALKSAARVRFKDVDFKHAKTEEWSKFYTVDKSGPNFGVFEGFAVEIEMLGNPGFDPIRMPENVAARLVEVLPRFVVGLCLGFLHLEGEYYATWYPVFRDIPTGPDAFVWRGEPRAYYRLEASYYPLEEREKPNEERKPVRLESTFEVAQPERAIVNTFYNKLGPGFLANQPFNKLRTLIKFASRQDATNNLELEGLATGATKEQLEREVLAYADGIAYQINDRLQKEVGDATTVLASAVRELDATVWLLRRLSEYLCGGLLLREGDVLRHLLGYSETAGDGSAAESAPAWATGLECRPLITGATIDRMLVKLERELSASPDGRSVDVRSWADGFLWFGVFDGADASFVAITSELLRLGNRLIDRELSDGLLPEPIEALECMVAVHPEGIK